jgi:hypothetical protein
MAKAGYTTTKVLCYARDANDPATIPDTVQVSSGYLFFSSDLFSLTSFNSNSMSCTLVSPQQIWHALYRPKRLRILGSGTNYSYIA